MGIIRKMVAAGLVLSFLLFLSVPVSFAAERLKLASAIKMTPAYYLPILAAEEKGIWKENGLDVEWVPFKGGPDMYQAVVAGDINIGLDPATGQLPGIARGLPMVLVSDLQNTEGVALYVSPGSRLKEPKDIKGARIGVTRLGAPDHAQARLVAKLLGVEKDVRYVGTGGISEKIAGLRSGAIDAFTMFIFPIIELKIKGEVRQLLSLEEYQPKEWVGHVIFIHRDFGRKSPETVKKVVRSALSAVDYIRKDADWAMRTMKKEQNYSDEAARQIYQILRFTRDGRINLRALENVRNFLMEYELVPKGKLPPVSELYTTEYLP